MNYNLMDYCFFGTCANDHNHLMEVLETIIVQSLKPKEIIIIDSGDVNNFKEIKAILDLRKIKIKYIFKKLSRVEALNLAIENISTAYSIRFDTRTRFNKFYAEEALKILNDEKLGLCFVGGVPDVIPEKKSFSGIICSEIMRRSYVFFYPRHREIGYTGFASSIYLGCFETKILKKIKYREDIFLISEDSLLASDYASNNFKLWLSSSLRLNYVARSSVFNTLRLFNTYGYCRFNSIVLSGNVHSKKRYLSLFAIIFLYFTLTHNFLLISFFIFPFFILFLNIYGELTFKNKNKKKIVYILSPIFASICQFSWILGFSWSLLLWFKVSKPKSNFIK
tara:strand:+ start:16808 stop:17818 length:1011 start_codon:yes stop_codon:yes gene_type:complete